MLILGIDSSTETAALGLIDDEELVGEINLSLYRRHSERLMPNINNLFKELEYSIRDIDGIAVTVGPGSFTGLRIGLSTVKGFAQALDVPVVGISTLEVIAYNYYHVEGLLVPMLDARRDRVYTALFDNYSKDKNFKDRRYWEDQTLPVDELALELKKISDNKIKNYYLLGNGTKVYEEEFINSELNLIIAPPSFNKPRGGVVAELGKKYLEEGINHKPAELLPNYLKKPQAEINYKRIGSE